jgi:hypothetical protein
VYVASVARNFYPENVTRLYPFLFFDFLEQQVSILGLSKLLDISFDSVFLFFQRLHLFVFLFFIPLAVTWILSKGFRSNTIRAHYMNIGILTSLCIIVLLITLSVLYPPSLSLNGLQKWTFVEESRYYAFVVFFLQQMLFLVFFQYRSKLKVWTLNVCRALFCCLAFSTIHGAYYVAKIILGLPENFYHSKNEFKLLDYTHESLKKTMRKNPGKKIVMFSSYSYISSYANLWENITPVNDKLTLDELPQPINKQTVLFAAVADEDTKSIYWLRQNQRWDSIGHFSNYNFYTIDAGQ